MMGVAEKDEDAFNRTLVELKLPTRLTRSTPGLSFNRTLVELKLIGTTTRQRRRWTFNRTLVELKRLAPTLGKLAYFFF